MGLGSGNGRSRRMHTCRVAENWGPSWIFRRHIKPTGVFPVVDGQPWEQESADLLHRCLEGWSNYSSAVEEKEDLNRLIQEAKEQGFCTFYDTLQQVESELGVKPVLNKLGVIVKIKESGVRKARIIWDLRESKINSLCRQGERVILPRLRDAIADANETYRQGGRPRFLAVDITNAFHNIPAGRDRAYTAAAFESPQGRKILVYDVLVFGLRRPGVRLCVVADVMGQVRSVAIKVAYGDLPEPQSANICGRPANHI